MHQKFCTEQHEHTTFFWPFLILTKIQPIVTGWRIFSTGSVVSEWLKAVIASR
jgi:hypothetical protein